jgi:hypothetical protein
MNSDDERKATSAEISAALVRLKTAFPRHTSEFFMLLAERISANKLTYKQLTEAVNEVIDTSEYGHFSIAQIINTANEQKKSEYNFMQFPDAR